MSKFDLEAYKKSRKIADTPMKKDKFVVLDECMHSVLGMPGLPLGHVTQVYGLSDTGKTSLLFHSAAQCQKQGILPVVIVTEKKVDWNRAKSMGFDRDKAIIEENVDTLEEGFDYIIKTLADVEMGELPLDVMIFWDSIGNTVSAEEITVNPDGTVEKKASMMKAAKVISERMRMVSPKVNNSRKQSHPNFAGLMFLNHAYTQPPAFPGGMPSLVPYGGKKIWYCSSLVLKTQRKKKLTATKDKVKMGYGIVSQITVDKNHLTNTAHSGEFVITANSIIPNEKSALDAHKKASKDSWGVIEDEFGEEFSS